MSSFAISAGAFLFGFSAVFLTGIPEAPAAWDRNDAPQSVQTVMTARERWESLTPEQRRRVQQRFERLQTLDESERQDLERRAWKRKRLEETVLSQLSPGARKRLMEAPAQHRRLLIDEMIEAEMRHEGRRIEAKLPEDIRELLAAASPVERRRSLAKFKHETRERISLVLVEDTAKALGYSQQDISRFMKLPIDRRMKLVLELRKEFTVQQVAASGLPPGLTRKDWDALDHLAPREYFTEVMSLRDKGLFGAPKTDSGARPAPERAREIGRELARCLRQDPQERLELSDLPPHRRRAILNQRRRDRVTTEVRKLKAFTPEQLEALETMPDDEFLLRARRVMQDLRRGKMPDVRNWQPGRRPAERARGQNRNGRSRSDGERYRPGSHDPERKAPGDGRR